MVRRGWLGKVLFFGAIFAVVTKYVYLIIPAIIALILGVIIRKRKFNKENVGRVIYIRQR